MSTMRWGTVNAALVTLMRARSGYGSPWGAAPTDAIVYDGPEVRRSNDLPSRYLVIGWPGDPGNNDDAGTSGQVVGTIGNAARSRDETGYITCRAVAQSNEAGVRAGLVATTQAQAEGVMAGLENLCRTTPTLGLDPSWMRDTQVMNDAQIRRELASGVVVKITFFVRFRTRI